FGAGSDLCFRCGGKGHWASECPGEAGGFLGFLRGFFGIKQREKHPPEEVLEALRILGYNSFRPGQAEAIMRVLSGISTLVVLPTGMGKSLCYQLPAFLYHRHSGSISLVISPLVSLMDDQVSGLPSALKAVCIHSNLSQSQSGKAQILLLSPESLVGSGSFSRFFRDFPPVAFACLDEAHCVSQWSHNFRPAYLRICKVLRERFGVRCFLGLTATATAATARDVAQHLGIPPENGIGAAGIPENLRLSVSVDSDRDQVGSDLRSFQGISNSGKKNWKILGKIRFWGEFGGIWSKFMEKFLKCWFFFINFLFFFLPQGQDLLELRRHIHENSVDFLTVKILIQRVFAPCKCLEIHGKNQENSKEISEFPKNSRICRGHERSIPIQELVETLDLREEAIQTLLCLLELHPEKFLELFPPLRSRCRIRIPGNSAAALREAARGCPPLGFLLAQDPSGSLGISGFLEFDAVALSDSMGWEFRRLPIQLQIPAGKSCGIQVEFQEFSFFFRAYGDLDGRELDSLCQFLNSRALEREKSELRRLRSCFRAFQRNFREIWGFWGWEFGILLWLKDEEEEIRAEIRKLLAAFPDEEFTGRAVARIFHGIGSPRFPSRIFGRDRRFWRRLLPLEFRSLSRLASQEILASR
uniref:DNA 3'-5' helicase n=1 Tax=Cyanistes caeruleus TaxID=156563 RepID=A0A8C0UYZ1_CYACU